MNHISKFAKLSKCVKMGVGNVIGYNVMIGENVVIGNYNKIYPNTRIYSNVTMGDHNVFLDNNAIGDHPVSSTMVFDEKVYNGVTIGHHNFFHTDNYIGGGLESKTRIGNYNKFLQNIHIGHDTIITDHVHMYPKVLLGGYSILLPYSGVGTQACTQQRTILGSYSFIGMLTAATNHKFPFYIYLGNKPLRLNTKRCPEGIESYKESLDSLLHTYKTMKAHQILDSLQNYPESIQTPLHDFFKHIKLI